MISTVSMEHDEYVGIVDKYPGLNIQASLVFEKLGKSDVLWTDCEINPSTHLPLFSPTKTEKPPEEIDEGIEDIFHDSIRGQIFWPKFLIYPCQYTYHHSIKSYPFYFR